MASVAVVPALMLIAGAACGLHAPDVPSLKPVLIAVAIAAWVMWLRRARSATALLVAGAFFLVGVVSAAGARDRALDTSLRKTLDNAFGGFAIDSVAVPPRHDPIAVRALLLEDASRGLEATTLRATVTAVRLDTGWEQTTGGVTFTVGGAVTDHQRLPWRAGRTINTFATFRRPVRYLDAGVPDFERLLALDGTTLLGSVKSGLLIEVERPGIRIHEIAAEIRAHVRRSVERWTGRHDVVSAAIVTAVLIGDRTGLPDDVRLRLQAAGTYHVIAISGGNIAILAAFVLALLMVARITGRPAALITIGVLVAYAAIVTAGVSVWRATLMAVMYLGARLVDHRSPPWQVLAIAGGLVVCLRPLDVRDPGFILTFGATAALLEGARQVAAIAPPPIGLRRSGAHPVVRWLIASLVASAAAEIALLPVTASIFSRVTSAGLVLNLVAVPLMGLLQIAGIIVACFDRAEIVAQPAGVLAHTAASALVNSARLVDVAPWLTTRVPPPSIGLVGVYYLGLIGAAAMRGIPRLCGLALLVVSATVIVTGQPDGWRTMGDSGTLRVTFLDVGQADATLMQFPNRSTVLVDAGGTPFGGLGFDIGGRVVAPAVWSTGVRKLDTLLLTHGDPDHIGGAPTIVEAFAPDAVWQGIAVPDHAGLQTVLARARAAGADVRERRAGEMTRVGEVQLRVLHPPPPDWERRQVRNDDSVVVELRYGEVAVLLAGDVGAEIERSILPHLSRTRVRILKVAHHGSRTSTSQELVEGWRPQIAVISCGRGNTFGHPAADVLARLAAVGAAIYRTDLDGQVTLDTDGLHVRMRTYGGDVR
jgi:competence protein ComEC